MVRHLNTIFALAGGRGRYLSKPIYKNSNAGGGGVAREGDVEAFNWSKHYLVQVSELFGKRYTKEIIT